MNLDDTDPPAPGRSKATPRQAKPSWIHVKAQLAARDQAELMALVQDLYLASKDNQLFLHTRYGLGDDLLKSYQTVLQRQLWPDPSRGQSPSVAKAKAAIADYKKASGKAAGVAELMVFYCEQAMGFIDQVGYEGDGYLSALERMFEQALQTIASLPPEQRPALWERLDGVRGDAHDLGYGLSDSMDALLANYGAEPD